MSRQPLIITCSPVGAEVTKADNPAAPYTPAEIAREAIAATRAGASIIHLHAREEDGSPSQRTELFAEAVRLIRQDVDVIIQISTGGAVTATPDERLQPVRELSPAPEMASLTLGTVNFGNDVFWNPPDLIATFAREFRERGIKPELEIFEAGMMTTAQRLVKQGLLEGPLHFDFVLGVPGALAGTPENLMMLYGQLPAGATWTVAGIGAAELRLGTMAIALGGHVRVGFEDNVFYRKGELATSNAQLVARIARIAHELDRPIATPDEARALLSMPQRSLA
jgi:3-keto-5-aminohexanoate cleavage enzyme